MTVPALASTDVYGEGAALGGGSLLLQFREFHAELTRLRAALLRGEQRAGQDPQNQPDPRDIAAQVNRRLHRLLDQQAAAARHLGVSVGTDVFGEVQYLKVALADELLLHGPWWRGRDHWMDNLLEMSLFGTRVAGERVFQRLDDVLAARSPPDPDLLSIYLAVLSLGFRGRHWRVEDELTLRAYRRKLAERLARGGVGSLQPGQGASPLCPGAYAATLSDGRHVRLPHLRPWAYGFLVLLAVWVLVAFGVWRYQTAPIRDVLRTPTVAQAPEVRR